MKNLPTYLLLTFSLLFFCSKDKSSNPKALTPEDLLIKDNEISGWVRSGDFWTASSAGDLNNYINGEAVIYTNRGFVEAAKQEYQGSILGNTETIELRIFDQGTEENAQSVFDELVLQMSSPIDWTSDSGDWAKIERFPLSQKLIFWKEKYFVSLTITSGLDEALNVLKTFGNNVYVKI